MNTLQDIQDIIEIARMDGHSDDQLGKAVKDYMQKVHANTNNYVKCVHCGTYQPPLSNICNQCKMDIYESD